ncbi:UdgX family uracil-DNA binding protein [Paracoccus endophyticus]|uniref:UdgX family uracil-DNA binding protein n=1 Tax=Paracoccus endophyticus TaxID=2233774 RepID=UPI000DD59DEA|nr:UdgX family uracil-DNA binding protein [Paracoccus endophyticus]
MQVVVLPATGWREAWRDAARRLAGAGVPPGEVAWQTGAGLFASDPLPPAGAVTVPRAFVDLADTVLCHRDPERFALLYAVLWRLRGDRGLLENPADPLVARLNGLARAVRRDSHKMRAFVRFREVPAAVPAPLSGDGSLDCGGDAPRRRFAAWFEPDHLIVARTAPFFARRFADMDWTILTPDERADFRDGVLTQGPGAPRPDLPPDASEALWATYFTNIFNPARIKLAAMRSEMPRKYWKNLPEAREIPAMLADAERRVGVMRSAQATVAPVRAAAISERYRADMPKAPDRIDSLADACRAAAHCTRCDLHCHATQTVWGEGPADAALMIVGEQPGDHEDLSGRPFVGPAGGVLDEAMAAAGVARDRVWLTNAVKHFKFTPRGKRRLHQSPDRGEIDACRWWLDLERRFIQPRLIMALGGTAAYALTGSKTGLGRRRGTVEETAAGPVMLSWHPSYILRLPDAGAAAEARAQLTEDLAQAARLLA